MSVGKTMNLLPLALLPLLVCGRDFLSPGLSPEELLARLGSPTAPLLFNNGIENVYHLEGAFQAWIQGKHPIEKGGVKKTGC